MPDEHELPTDLVIPDDEDEGAEQAPTSRLLRKPAVRTRPTRRDRREFNRAVKQAEADE